MTNMVPISICIHTCMYVRDRTCPHGTWPQSYTHGRNCANHGHTPNGIGFADAASLHLAYRLCHASNCFIFRMAYSEFHNYAFTASAHTSSKGCRTCLGCNKCTLSVHTVRDPSGRPSPETSTKLEAGCCWEAGPAAGNTDESDESVGTCRTTVLETV